MCICIQSKEQKEDLSGESKDRLVRSKKRDDMDDMEMQEQGDVQKGEKDVDVDVKDQNDDQ